MTLKKPVVRLKEDVFKSGIPIDMLTDDTFERPLGMPIDIFTVMFCSLPEAPLLLLFVFVEEEDDEELEFDEDPLEDEIPLVMVVRLKVPEVFWDDVEFRGNVEFVSDPLPVTLEPLGVPKLPAISGFTPIPRPFPERFAEMFGVWLLPGVNVGALVLETMPEMLV